jgi:hypothetical protein
MLLCISVGMMSVHIMHASNYIIVDIMIVSNANFYAVCAKSSSYLKVWQEGTDCLIAVLGLSFLSKHYGKKMHVRNEVLYELLQKNEYNDISESKYNNESEINVKILSCGEQSVSFDD